MIVTASSRLVHFDEDCSPPPFKLARDSRSRSRPKPQPVRETLSFKLTTTTNVGAIRGSPSDSIIYIYPLRISQATFMLSDMVINLHFLEGGGVPLLCDHFSKIP